MQYVLILALLVVGGAGSSAAGQDLNVQTITPSQPAAGAQFGHALAMWDSTLLVGAPFAADESGTAVGAAFVFARTSNGSWIEVQRLTPSVTRSGMRFGYSVALSESLAVVGAPLESDSGSALAGIVYVFEREPDGTFQETARLEASDVHAASFGRSVSLTEGGLMRIDADGVTVQVGPTILIGAPEATNDDGAPAGRAYFFERQDDGIWNETSADAPWTSSGDDYGFSVAACFGRALVGAPLAVRLDGGTGKVRAFERRADGWVDVGDVWYDGPVDEPEMESARRFGHALTCGVYISSPGDESDVSGFVSGHGWAGEAAGGWRRHSIFAEGDADPQVVFGAVLAESGDRLLIGSTTRGTEGNASGQVQVLARGPLRYIPVDTLENPGEAQDRFGSAVATWDGPIAVGAPGSDSAGEDAGAVYLFSLQTSVSAPGLEVPPDGLRLEGVYPNPLQDEGAFEIVLSAPAPVSLHLYDVLGREVLRRDVGPMNTGRHIVPFDVTGIASGVYFYVLSAGSKWKSGSLLKVH